jgi:hypothetical protein
MSNIPRARALINRVIETEALTKDGLLDLEAALVLMTRQPAIRKAPKRHAAPTPQQVRDVLWYYDHYPQWSQQSIAERVELNSGRVSEIVNKYR